MCLWILSGLIVFNEARFYSIQELLAIAGSLTLCIIGIIFLIKKQKAAKKMSLDEKKESDKSTATDD